MTPAPLLTLKVLSVLLSYPEPETLAALDDMAEVLEREKLLPPPSQNALLDLIRSWAGMDVLDLQERYVALFDRGRALSLHLYEHLYGESRDRGQALVELTRRYRSHGYEISSRELPDYIPLFLEYLSRQSRAEAVAWLRNAMPVLSLLGARLRERNSPFQAIFAALEGFAGEPEDLAEIRKQAAGEGPDASIQHMDEIWEEEAVSFLGNTGACRNQAVHPVKPGVRPGPAGIPITPR